MAQEPFPITQFVFANTLPVAKGYLIIQLNKDVLAPTGQIGSQVKVKVLLDASGEITDSPLFWPNIQLTPNDSLYILNVYTAEGQRVLGPISILLGLTVPPTGFGQAFGSTFAS